MLNVIPTNIKSVVQLETAAVGPRVVIFSGVHGDEMSGVFAVERLLFDVLGGRIDLRRGSLVLVRANEQAISKRKRYLRRNLNRLFKDGSDAAATANSYEFRRAKELKPLLAKCDYFLDLHSAPIAQDPFIITDRDTVRLFATLGIRKMITGWSQFSKSSIGGDAESYAQSYGAKAATLEAGCHFDPAATDVAYRAAFTLLTNLGMTGAVAEQSPQPTEVFDIYRVITKTQADFRFTGEVENFKFIKRGQPFAIEADKPIKAREDSYLLIPMKPEETKLGEEVGYLGRKPGT